MGKLIVTEGLDASGKSTQTNLIKKYLENKKIKYKYLHFPLYGQNEAAKVISSYLKGDFGNIDEVDPVFVAGMYAMDRFLYLPKLKKDLEENEVVLLDRYVFSNMAYQGAKYNNEAQSSIMRDWINELEFGFYELPYPNLNIFFDTPIDFIEERLIKKREGEDRRYLDGKADIHEMNIEFQIKVRENYLAVKEYPNFIIINCAIETILEGTKLPMIKSLSPEEIFDKYATFIDMTLISV
jgi:dTMP kinase